VGVGGFPSLIQVNVLLDGGINWSSSSCGGRFPSRRQNHRVVVGIDGRARFIGRVVLVTSLDCGYSSVPYFIQDL
jgi:hypothetical protein